jgi:hypothetical protein
MDLRHIVARFNQRRVAQRILNAFGVNDMKKLFRLGNQFGVLSGYRAELHKHENQDRHGDIMGDLQSMGYSRLIPLKSAWEDMATNVVHREKSILVPGMHFADCVSLMARYKQDAIIYKDPTGTIGIYFGNGEAIMAYDATEKDLAVLTHHGYNEYSKGRNFSFGLQLVDDKKFHWSGKPLDKASLLAQLVA